MKAPPRSMWAPLCFRASATSRICSWFSTAHGPATTTSFFPPIFTPRPRSTTVESGLVSREASLYGDRMGITFSTPGCASRQVSFSLLRSSPMAPKMTRSVPLLSCTLQPNPSMSSFTWSICSAVAPFFIEMIIFPPYRFAAVGGSHGLKRKGRGRKNHPRPLCSSPEQVSPQAVLPS